MSNEVSIPITCYPRRFVYCDGCLRQIEVSANVMKCVGVARAAGYAVLCAPCSNARPER